MKQPIQRLALLLAVLCVFPLSLSACGNKSGDKGSETTPPQHVSKYDVSGGGRDFIILNREADSYLFAYNEVDTTLQEDDTDNRVSSAVFSRNQHVNEVLGVNIVGAQMTREKMRTEIEKCHMGGIQTYDVAMAMVEDSFALAISGYLYEWGRIPYVDMTKSYWMSEFYNSTTIGGYNFYCPGSANISAYNTVGVTFFNKALRTKYTLENPYDLVKENRWTIEAMQEMCKEATLDTDGLSGMTYRDSYGLAVNSFVWQPFFYSSGYMMVEKDQQDIPYLSATSSGMAELVTGMLTTINNMLNDNHMAILTNREEYSNADYQAGNLETDIFLNDRALFWVENIYGQYSLRNMSTEYGILPMPKWNPDASYTSYTHAGHSSVMSVPLTAPDLSLSGAVIEEMTAYSDQVLIPEFYEQTIRVRGVRDAESYEMLDMIYEHVVIDLAVIMKYAGLGLDTAIRNMLNFNDSGYATMFQSQGNTYRSTIDNMALKFASNAANQYTGE